MDADGLHITDSARRIERESDPIGTTIVARSADGGFWTLRPNDSRLRAYTPTGAPARSVRIVDDQFVPWSSRIRGEGLRVVPRPRRSALVELDANHLIVLTWVPDPDWRPLELSGGTFQPAAVDLNRVYDTVIALVDARSGRTTARKRVTEALLPVDGSADLFYRTHEDPLGHAVTRVWRLRVHTR